MSKVAIVYFSGTGSTALLAEAVAEGARSVEGTEVELHRITGSQIVEGRWSDDAMLAKLQDADAIIFGSPTYIGSVAAQFKAFVDATGGIWFTRGWKNKLAGGFTISGSPSGDKQGTLNYLAVVAAQHGMTWINSDLLPGYAVGQPEGANRLGSFAGVIAHNQTPHGEAAKLQAGDAAFGQAYGKRVAEWAQRLSPVLV
jgi:NAD(P)H dehydrogenase (quinone)